jgi:hypothetical protein
MLFSMDFASASADALPHRCCETASTSRRGSNGTLHHIFADWAEWEAAYRELESRIGAYAALQGTLGKGADHLLTAMRCPTRSGSSPTRCGTSRR